LRARQQEFDVARSEWETTQKSHEAGSVSAVDVLVSQARLAAARDALNAADAAYKLSLLQWVRSEGRLEEFVNNETH
jgi:outer membrane protein TolC